MEEAMTVILNIGFPSCFQDLLPQNSYFFFILFLIGLLYLLPGAIIRGRYYCPEMMGIICQVNDISPYRLLIFKSLEAGTRYRISSAIKYIAIKQNSGLYVR
jgi:hypothetical protein